MVKPNLIKQKLVNPKITLKNTGLILLLSLGVALTAPVTLVQSATRQEQINQLRASNNALQQERAGLLAEAGNIEAALTSLAAQIASLESQIRDNQAKAVQTQAEIDAIQVEIAKQRKLLGQNIRAMYLEDDMTPAMALAASKNLSEFVDKEQYRISVKDKIKGNLDRINELKTNLDKQKAALDNLIASQQEMQAQLDGQRAEQARLLGLNQQQRQQLEGEMQANNSQIAQLRSQQAAENARLFGGGVSKIADPTGYPWAGVGFPNTSADTWGMYKRQCVSYTAWRVATSGRNMPYWGGRGNANQWDNNARAAGIPVDGSPRVGDVAISNSGTYGHAMYVEAVFGNGTIRVSQYNAGWDGRYSEATISAAGLSFIHF